MICAECDKLDKKFIRPRNESMVRRFRGTLTPEHEENLRAEESAALSAIQNHRMTDHQRGDTYE